MTLFDSHEVSIGEVAGYLKIHHYLGPATRGFAWISDEGVLVFGNPSSRRLPQRRWLELLRWCLRPGRNNGSRQWAKVRRWLLVNRPWVTTVVSYSDPSVGHTGALYKACNWTWAPTWHRLRPPPSGNGDWGTGQQSVKDRWICVLQPDTERDEIIRVKDAALVKSWSSRLS